jgi:hypothetical protein
VRRADAGQFRDQQRLAGAPGEIPARKELAQPSAACGIDTAALRAELCFFKHAKDQAVHRERCQALRPDPEFHAMSSMLSR